MAEAPEITVSFLNIKVGDVISIKVGRRGYDTDIRLNGLKVGGLRSLSLEAGVDRLTTIRLEAYPSVSTDMTLADFDPSNEG